MKKMYSFQIVLILFNFAALSCRLITHPLNLAISNICVLKNLYFHIFFPIVKLPQKIHLLKNGKILMVTDKIKKT